MSAKQADGNNRRTKGRGAGYYALKVSFGGVMLALSLILAYVEVLFPINLGIPAVKLGLANIVSVFLLYKYGAPYTFTVAVLRVILSNLLFGSVTGFMYGLAGAVLSITVMLLLKKTDRFSPVGVSVSGGICHNLAQITVAALLLETAGIFSYLPVLIITGTVSGTLIGILAAVILKRMK